MQKPIVVILFLSALLYAGGPKPTQQKNGQAWSDNFSSSKLSNKWLTYKGGRGFYPENLDLSHKMLGLKLTQNKGKDGEWVSKGVEVMSREVYGFGTYTWEFRASSTATTPDGVGVGQSGSSSGVFSYIDDSAKGGAAVEIDFEVEGTRPNVVWLVNWVQVQPRKWTSTGVRVKASSEFHTYSYVWSSAKIEFFIDGKLAHTYTENVPQKPAHVIMNHWGTNSPKWGGMATDGTRMMWIKKFSFEPQVEK